MDYFNKLELIKDIFDGNTDYTRHLSKLSFEDIARDLMRKKETIPLLEPFEITEDVKEDQNWMNLSEKVRDEMSEIFLKFRNPKTITDDVLLSLLNYKQLYPNVTTIYNFLSNAYMVLGNNKKQYETILETIEKFPDYLFGKLALAEYYISTDNHKKIPEILDNKLDIFLFVPRENNTYHLSEIHAFYTIIGSYYLLENKTGQAVLCYLFLNEFKTEQYKHNVFMLGKQIVFHELKKMTEKAAASLKEKSKPQKSKPKKKK